MLRLMLFLASAAKRLAWRLLNLAIATPNLGEDDPFGKNPFGDTTFELRPNYLEIFS